MESKAPTHDWLSQREGLSNNRVNLPKAALAAPPAAFAAYAECSTDSRGNDELMGRGVPAGALKRTRRPQGVPQKALEPRLEGLPGNLRSARHALCTPRMSSFGVGAPAAAAARGWIPWPWTRSIERVHSWEQQWSPRLRPTTG